MTVDENPLVIPLKENTKTAKSLALLQRLKDTIEGVDEQPPIDVANSTTANTEAGDQTKTLEERVVRELMAEANGLNADTDAGPALTVPVKADELELDGAKESTLGDYENIPIAQFGLAMLRGMGLKDEEIKNAKSKEPELRPKGMGLGADKAVRPQKLLVAPSVNEVLIIKKNASVKILAGRYKDLYGMVSTNLYYNFYLVDLFLPNFLIWCIIIHQWWWDKRWHNLFVAISTMKFCCERSIFTGRYTLHNSRICEFVLMWMNVLHYIFPP